MIDDFASGGAWVDLGIKVLTTDFLVVFFEDADLPSLTLILLGREFEVTAFSIMIVLTCESDVLMQRVLLLGHPRVRLGGRELCEQALR